MLIGKPFTAKFTRAIDRARAVAYDSEKDRHGVLLQAAERPLLGVRGETPNMEGYIAIAEALSPLQIKRHNEFFGDRWTAQNTMSWLRRFTPTARVRRAKRSS